MYGKIYDDKNLLYPSSFGFRLFSFSSIIISDIKNEAYHFRRFPSYGRSDFCDSDARRKRRTKIGFTFKAYGMG